MRDYFGVTASPKRLLVTRGKKVTKAEKTFQNKNKLS